MIPINCEYCHTLPHRSGCPAAEDETKICLLCGREIVEGEFFVEIDGLYFHGECDPLIFDETQEE